MIGIAVTVATEFVVGWHGHNLCCSRDVRRGAGCRFSYCGMFGVDDDDDDDNDGSLLKFVF